MNNNKALPNLVNKLMPINTLIWWLFLLGYCQTIFHYLVFDNLASITYLYSLIFTIPFAIILYIFTSFKFRFSLIVILSSVVIFSFAAHYIYFKIYDSLFSIYSLANGIKNLLQFSSETITFIFAHSLEIVLFIAPIFLLIIWRRGIAKEHISWTNRLVAIIILLTSCLIQTVIISTSDQQENSLYKLLTKINAPLLMSEKGGLLTMISVDVYRFLMNFEEELKIDDIPIIPKDDIEYNILDIDFKTLIENEKNKTLQDMSRYFAAQQATNKNEYTGLFAGKNLIFITAEAFDPIAINPQVTPNLYMLANNGFIFENYYQPLYPISTADGEYMNLTGYLPKEGVWSSDMSSNIMMPFALADTFKSLGYSANSYHNYSFDYYNRQKFLKGLGFKYLACGNGLEKRMNCDRWPTSDDEMIKVTTKDYIDNQQFLTYYMSMSGHLEYNFKGGNSMATKNKNATKDLPYSDKVKAYIATQVEFDKALGRLIKALEAANKLDDTVIVIAPDHQPYGLKSSHLNEVSEIDRSDKFDHHKMTLIIYNSAMPKPIKVNKIASSIDILPTIYNLFGIKYDSRLLIGKDILSDAKGLVIFADRSWITQEARYNSRTTELTTNQEISQSYIDYYNELVNQKFSLSSLIFKQYSRKYLNYFKTLALN